MPGTHARTLMPRRMTLLRGLVLAVAGIACGAHSQTISTVAGGTGGGGASTDVALNGPRDVVVGPTGELYVVDTYNNVVRKVTVAGAIITLAGNGTEGYAGDGGPATSAELDHPWGVAVDVAGNVFIADSHNNRVRKVDSAGTITTFAGNGGGLFAGDGGPATSAQISAPLDVALDHAGNLYIADSGNSRIRKVDTGGNITTVAGNGTYGFAGDGGPATSAQLAGAVGVALDAAGTLFIADPNNNRVRKVDGAGSIWTVAGGGSPPDGIGDGGPAVNASLSSPSAVEFDAAGNMYVADTGRNVVRRVGPTGTIMTVAGQPYVANDGYCYVLAGTTCFSGDNGPAMTAKFYGLFGVTVDGAGTLYIADAGNNRIRAVAGGIVNTVVGNGTQSYSGDGGPGTQAQLFAPAGIALDAGGNLFIADHDNNVVRKLTINGTITTIAGVRPGPSSVFGGGYSGDGGPATSAELHEPSGVVTDSAGNVYIADTRNNVIRKVDIGGSISTVVGTGTGGYAGDGGPAAAAQIYGPMGLALDAAQNLYIADTSNHVVRKVDAGGTITTVAGGGAPADGLGDGGMATAASMGPVALATDAAGNLFIADFDHARVRKVNAAGLITTVAGNGDIGGYGDGGPATSAAIWGPRGVAVDSAGNVYVSAKEDFVVRRIDPSGIIDTIAGDGRTFGFSGDGGPATAAQMIQPWGVAVGSAGKLSIADTGNGRVRRMTIPDVFANGFEN